MEIIEGSNQFLLRQSVDWLKTRQDNLVIAVANGMINSPDFTHSHLPSFLMKLVAKDLLHDLIKRLESNSFDAPAAKKKMLGALKKGATVKNIVSSVDLMVTVISAQARQELHDRPAVSAALMKKTEYVATLMKATIASAAIEYEQLKMNKLPII